MSGGKFYRGDEDADDSGLPGLRLPQHGRPRSRRDGSQRDPKPPRLHGLWGGLLGDHGHLPMHGLKTLISKVAAAARLRGESMGGCFARHIVAWKVPRSARTDFVLDALEQTACTRPR